MDIQSYYTSSAHSDYYGAPRGGGRTHQGDDFSHSTVPGTIPVPALLAGRVVGKLTPADWHGFGHQVTIESQYNGETVRFSYAHGSSASPLNEGDWVNRGQRTIYEGTSGSTTGSCAHIELIINGSKRNPYPVIMAIVGGSGGGGGGTSPGWPAHDMYGEAWVNAIQQKANRLGAGLSVDGKDGPATQKWVSEFQSLSGLDADGVAGPQTNAELDNLLNLQVDGELGTRTIRRLQYAFGVKADGDWGYNTTLAIQKHLGATPDGEVGPETYKALQRALKVEADGAFGYNSVKALQTWLNTGGVLVPVPEDTTPKPTPTPTPTPKPAATPRTPVYPEAIRGWTVPLAEERSSGASIDWLIVHHQATTRDDEEFFKMDNDRGSCPTWQVKADGKVVEFIPPNQKPSSSGNANNRSVAVETQNTSGNVSGTNAVKDVDWGISKESHEATAQLAAWLSQQKEINGIPVGFKLDRDHLFGDREIKAKTGIDIRPTVCPGPSMDMDWIVERAKEIVKPSPEPEPEPEPVPVTREELLRQRSAAAAMVEFFDRLLQGSKS